MATRENGSAVWLKINAEYREFDNLLTAVIFSSSASSDICLWHYL